MSATCRCKEVEFKEGQTYKRVRGIGHHVKFSCAPNTFEDGYHDPEEDGADEKPTRKRREKKVKKPKRYKSFMSNGLKNALVIARHGMEFEQQIANYQTRKADQDLIAWAATHTCSQLRKFRMMGGKKLGELIKLVQRQELRLACGCPCTGVPRNQTEGDKLAARLEGVLPYINSGPTGGSEDPVATIRFVAALLKGSSVPVVTGDPVIPEGCDCPQEGSVAWEEGDRCEAHTPKA